MVADTIVRMIAVRHRLVAAIRAVNMSGVVTAAAVTGGAAVRVLGRNLDHMLIHMIIMRMMQMTLMEIVDVPLMAHCLVAAAGSRVDAYGRHVGRQNSWSSVHFLSVSEIFRNRRGPLLAAYRQLAVGTQRNAGKLQKRAA